MSVHFLDIEFPEGKIIFNSNSLDIHTKGLIFMSKEHEGLGWDRISNIIIEKLEDSAIILKIRIDDKDDIILSSKEELNINKRNKIQAKANLLRIYFKEQ